MSAIVTCHKNFLFERGMQRGYMLHEIMPCVIKKDGDQWTIDTAHPAYPLINRRPQPRTPVGYSAPIPDIGPGAMLKKQLKKIGIHATEQCACNARAAMMDALGCDWCEQNIDTIVGWLREEAARRKLPFIELFGVFLIRRAIRLSRRAFAEYDATNKTVDSYSQTSTG